ncbi:diacylglycerol kinase family enzyme [Actinoplanes campanulatus]|uniref:Diacylglycerol kinase family enzyme n=1 Tax=Actinoplanes campanulatus TaxID=113559 RepID=A0A7W5AAH0_9ACTN|nr:diacylglycerol kinase family protein [Actinoplanes campanulatus]MBB3092671.1 diacylglycerol kinase family enzyme [Actinoplanes campanulatus]GGM98195.1 sphingosine kinase [Actinoplanes campanulatus]GID34232.1 sphingosine kinase [Actinoplanes campanulatus]
MTGPRSAVVVNPTKVADPDHLRRTLHEGLRRAGWPQPTWYETTAEDPGRGQARRAVADGAELVFACGGDGTVTAVVTALAGTGVALAVLPAGTGNLLAANLGLGNDPATGLEVALEGGRRRIDVGAIDDRCFVVMAGMGFDAQMLEDTSEKAKKRIGWLAYLGGAAKHLLDRPMRVRIRLDGGPPMPRRPAAVIVGNVGRLQGGVRLLSKAEPDDGKLNVAILSPTNLAHWAALVWAVLSRRERVPLMETYTAQRVEIYSNRARARQLDGDTIAPGKVMKIHVRPKALLLCVPQPDADPDLAYDADAAARRAEPVREAAEEKA